MKLPRISQWVVALEARRAHLTDPERIAEMDLLIEHLAAEGDRDLTRTMATLSPRGIYHSWGGSSPYTATIDEQELLYHQVLEGSANTFNLTLEIERCFSGPDGICVDGVLHKEATADEVVEMGHSVPPDADPDAPLVVSRRMAVLVSFIDGLMAGEDMYRDDHAVVTSAAEWSQRFDKVGSE